VASASQFSGGMQLAAVLVSVVATVSTAHAGAVAATSAAVAPSTQPEEGGFTMWGAGDVHENVYVGGEVAFQTFDSSDLGVSLHALVGVKSRLSERIVVLADAGAGVTNHVTFQLGLFGTEGGFEDEGTSASGAVRVHLVGELGTLGMVKVGIGLSSEARSTLDGEAGVGVGLGLYLLR
jgi:hypothetical protein